MVENQDNHNIDGLIKRISKGVYTNLGEALDDHTSRDGLHVGELSWRWGEGLWGDAEQRELESWLERPTEALSGKALTKLWSGPVSGCMNAMTEWARLKAVLDAQDVGGERIVKVRDILRRARDLGRGAPSPDAAIQVLDDWQAILRELDHGVDAPVDKKGKATWGKQGANQLERKWPIVTAPLAYTNPHQFLFVRPSAFDCKSQIAKVLGLAEGYTVSDPEKMREYYLGVLESTHPLATAIERARPSFWEEYGLLGVSAVIIWAEWFEKRQGQQANVARILQHHHVILQGPPGTGKTFLTEQIARSLSETMLARTTQPKTGMGGLSSILSVAEFLKLPHEERDGLVVQIFTQFHASYDYEDFVRGFRARSGVKDQLTFDLVDGPLAQLLTLATEHPESMFLLVIDEINRADLARVLGECIYLLDRREGRGKKAEDAHAVRPRYVPHGQVWLDASGGRANVQEAGEGVYRQSDRLWVPANFFLIGTMNTADRSIALIDMALRRRFAFVDILPDHGLAARCGMKYAKQKGVDKKERARWKDLATKAKDWLDRLNGTAEGQETVGEATDPIIRDPGHRIGHSYFMKGTLAEIEAALRYQLIPMVDEYRSTGVSYDKARWDALRDEILDWLNAD